MYFKLPQLPFDSSQVAGWLSHETLDFHHDRHHRAYVEKLNALLKGSGFEQASLEEIVMRAKGSLFDNAAQSWNHTFYWLGIGGQAGNDPQSAMARNHPELLDGIKRAFGSLEKFRAAFSFACTSLFGSGWVWLVMNDKDETLEIVQTQNAGSPMTLGLRPLLACDVWEHAYYIDFRNSRGKYVEGFMNTINWSFVARNFRQAGICDLTSIMCDGRGEHSLLHKEAV